ncbi:MAG TPA: endonuclease MutS2 [Acidobacteriota bacterium]|nr:endonuclease MutS2 [Acidobacteriota bacterium]
MIDQHTLQTLEFPKVIAAVAGKCLTAYGTEVVGGITPLFDKEEIDRRQDEIAQMKDIVRFGSAFPLYRLEDCREFLTQALLEGSFLDPKDMLKVLELVEVSMDLNGYDQEERAKFPAVAAYLPKIRAFPELKKEIRKAIDENGEVRDNASRELKRIREGLFDARRKIVARLESVLTGQRKQAGWQDDVVTQRNGRYVIPVVASQYSNDMGILHDRSQSGATFYVEPKETVDLNNRINQLMQDERLELDRILRAITSEIAQRAYPLRENCRLIGILDMIHAAATLAVEIDANRPTIDTSSGFSLVDARHPLLIFQLGRKEDVVPLTLTVDESRQAVVVTGPNTGGKTIALKAIGLTVLMAQSGLPIPADEKSRIGIFNQIYADIGDEQSIELSLSTFSSHVKNVVAATNGVSPHTLVLLDEIGAGTDPKEGAALAEAIILYMIARGSRLIATTHYSYLKTLALEHPEIENASLEFDRESLAPTYRLQVGIPGSSYAVEIAKRLGMPDEVCDHACLLLGPAERSLSDLIAALETELATVRNDRAELTERLNQARQLEEGYRAQVDKLNADIETEKKNALEQSEQLLERARKETERLVADIRRTQAEKKAVKELHQHLKSMQQEVASQKRQLEAGRPRSKWPEQLKKGDRVRILTLDQEGEIERMLRGDRARVRVGSMTTVVELRHLEPLADGPVKQTAQAGTSFDNGAPFSPEIHLRGMTVEEALEALDKFLDKAVVSGLTQIYVIHGKGTGALRRTLTDYLRKHPEVVDLRLGNWNEGGAGVTIVKLKE